MRISKCSAQPICIGGHRNQVNMIRHKTVAPDFRLSLQRGLSEKIDIQLVVSGLKENRIPSVATLGYVVRVSRENNSRETRHGEIMTNYGNLVNCHRNS
jgi:hypothetical protein